MENKDIQDWKDWIFEQTPDAGVANMFIEKIEDLLLTQRSKLRAVHLSLPSISSQMLRISKPKMYVLLANPNAYKNNSTYTQR